MLLYQLQKQLERLNMAANAASEYGCLKKKKKPH